MKDSTQNSITLPENEISPHAFPPEVDALIGDIYQASGITDAERASMAQQRLLDLYRELSALESDILPPHKGNASDAFKTDRDRVLRHLRALFSRIYVFASRLPNDPHYETIRSKAPPTESDPLPKPTVKLCYDTEINRYALLLIVRMARVAELLCPEEHLTDDLRALLKAPFYEALSKDQTPFRCPFGFYYSGNHIGLLKAEEALSDLIFAEADQSFSIAKARQLALMKKKRNASLLPQDVLVGALRSAEQLEVNLQKRFYHLPARLYRTGEDKIRYIALYQSEALFGQAAGIRYYGEITSGSVVPRKSLPIPCRPGTEEEAYYRFEVKEWLTLPRTILPRLEGPRALQFTNFSLLHEVEYSYELFRIRTMEQLALQNGIKAVLKSPAETVPILDGAFTLRAEENGILRIRHADGAFALLRPYTLSQIQKHPLRALTELSDLLIF